MGRDGEERGSLNTSSGSKLILKQSHWNKLQSFQPLE
jgi:hypothetical protein